MRSESSLRFSRVVRLSSRLNDGDNVHNEMDKCCFDIWSVLVNFLLFLMSLTWLDYH